ncbi:MAG: nitroreductase [Actinomycetia bacterium]|nr:nitroreductase [Actinomycetes bacterium]MCH9701178.1 nitroreductase [Actinomycetes bacterium]MCH9759895.1 nitroreductase [Actinomycetes bacterium]
MKPTVVSARAVFVEVRLLAGSLPDAATLERALDLAARAPSVQNSQPWRWRVGRDGLDLYVDWSRQLGDTDSDRRDVLLSCGAVLDHCLTALAAVGWSPRVRRFPDPDDSSHLALIELVEMPARPVNIELAEAIPRRRADRRRYSAESIPAGTLEFFHIRAARCKVAMGVVPKIRWARLEEGDVTLRYARDVGSANGADTDDAAMVVLGTDSDTDSMRLRAGETLSQIALSATAMGLASCPLTQPLQNARDRLALGCEVFEGEAYPQTLLRLGWAPTSGDPLTPVARRPVSQITTWDAEPGRVAAP